MAHCRVCGEFDGLAFECNYCGSNHCPQHRLPEQHNCYALRRNPKKESIKTRDDGAVGSGAGYPDPEPPVEDQDGSDSEGSNYATIRFLRRIDSFVTTLLLVALAVLYLGLRFLFTPQGLTAAVIVLGIVGGVSAVYGTGIDPVDDTVDGVLAGADEVTLPEGNETATPAPAATATQSSTADAGGSAETDTDSGGSDGDTIEEIEQGIHEHVNREREERGHSPLNFDAELSGVARSHSEDMAERGYFSHTSPDGSSFSDRYEAHDYRCRVPTSGNTYSVGGENIAMRTVAYSSEEEIAQEIVDQWMRSEGHRENILKDYWQNQGIGVAIGESESGQQAAYATQNFC